MKVLFLDIDGVLNSEQLIRQQQRYGIYDEAKCLEGIDVCQLAKSNLLYVLDCIPELRVVVHSTRRKRFSLEEIAEAISIPLERFAGITDLDLRDKSQAIQKWLSDHDVEKFVIVEDSPMYGFDKENLLYIDPTDGFLLTHAKRAVVILGGNNDKKLYLF